ncbi:hypothetical protein [Catellatospora methionotrophica]|uniref:hypothetical protein n=1 Tax=Catellatospora methionotrophica TaxID=121620 RepID=UPI003401DBAD
MAHLSRMLRLSAVAVLVAAVVAVAPRAAVAGEDPPAGGIEPKILAAVCAELQGGFHQDPRPPYRYGCGLADGEFDCLETRCSFRPAGDLLPLEESCTRSGGGYLRGNLTYVCLTDMHAVELTCDEDLTDCDTSVANEQPMPRPRLVTKPA